MRIERKTRMEVTAEELAEKVREGTLAAGWVLLFPDQAWKVLESKPGGALLFRCTGNTVEMRFGETNDYDKSDVKKYLEGDFIGTIPEEIRALMGDSKPFLLSKDEVEKYMPREIDRIACDRSGDTRWWWTRSASRGYASHTWYVGSSGYVFYDYASTAYRFSPACGLWLKSGTA